MTAPLPHELMCLHVRALFTHDDAGCVQVVNEPGGGRPPRVAEAGWRAEHGSGHGDTDGCRRIGGKCNESPPTPAQMCGPPLFPSAAGTSTAPMTRHREPPTFPVGSRPGHADGRGMDGLMEANGRTPGRQPWVAFHAFLRSFISARSPSELTSEMFGQSGRSSSQPSGVIPNWRARTAA